MHYYHTTFLSAALVVGALSITPQAATQHAATQRVSSKHSQFFPQPNQGLVIGDKESQNLAELLDQFAVVTGEHLMYSNETELMLTNASTQLTTALDVVPEDVYSVVQDVLIRNRFAIIDVRREEPRMLAVVSLDSPERATIRQQSIFVEEEQLDEYLGHSALLITTVVKLPHLDVRTMGASMRQLVVDPSTMQIIPIPESHSLVITGFGNAVHYLAHLLKQADRGAASGAEQDRSAEIHRALMRAADRLGAQGDE